MSFGSVPTGKHDNKDVSWVKPLADGIIGRAIIDYVDSLISQNHTRISEAEAFFRGGWFSNLCLDNVEPERLIRRARKYAKEFCELADQHQPFRINCKKALQDSTFPCPICGTEVVCSVPVPLKKDVKPLFTRIVKHKCTQCRIAVKTIYKQSRITVLNCEHCEHCYPFKINKNALEVLICDRAENDEQLTSYNNVCEYWERRFDE